MHRFMILTFLGLALAACSTVKRAAVDVVGNALAGGNGGVYASDDDPDLIRESLPFGLKTFEGLLEASPRNRRVLEAAALGFTAYAYLLADEANRIDGVDIARARTLRARASNLYLRGRDYALRGIELRHPGFTADLYADAAAALAWTTEEDIDFLYWAGASWAASLGAAKDDLDLLAELPLAGALVGRVLELDETYDGGAAHEFFIAYEGGRPGGSAEQARLFYRRALELSKGTRASVHLALAEAVSVQEQDLGEFRALIAAALAVDPDLEPNQRLTNTIAQRRARWLEGRIPDLFVAATVEEE